MSQLTQETSFAIAASRFRQWLFVILITVAALTDAVNSTILVVAREHLMGSTHSTPDEIAWVNMSYLAAKLTAFPVAAWLTTRLRAATLLPIAVSGLLAGSLACAGTNDLGQLILWRVVQGFSGALLLVVGQTVLFEVFPPSEQGTVQAIFAFSTVMAPTTLSPILQGWAVDNYSWSWVFLSNIPLCLVGYIAVLALPPLPATRNPSKRFDWVGVIFLAVAMTAIVFVLQEGSRHNWFDDLEILELTVVGLLSFLAFAAWQLFRQNNGALVDLATFKDQHFGFGFLVSLVAGFALFGSAFIIPAFSMSVLHLSPTYAGMLLMPSGATVGIGLLVAGVLIQLKGLAPVKPIPFGILCFMTAMWLLSGSTSASGLPDMMPALLLRGFGLGLLFVSLTLVTLGDLRGSTVPHGVALFNFGRQLGGQIGIAFLTTYLDHQVALNRTILSGNIAAGNQLLVERQQAIASLLTDRGYETEQATVAATAVIQEALQGQVATLSFNECFLSVSLLFVFAAPFLILVKVGLGKLMPHADKTSVG
ncbi:MULTISPECIES: DHA2 family efflux MFS transporter permease subunit [unclassified Ensifer]|uniref:DHA2 family efflux MFS transporter permease subunit n=1 Tax=unclassified Ensifer TaxID=2633371 RepID=UPI001AED8B44|nr:MULTISPECIES: DHA2 family efflux MFS transporter permease subunit [unclassified Ensifer]